MATKETNQGKVEAKKFIAIKNIVDGRFSLSKKSIIEIDVSDSELSLSPSDIIASKKDKEGNDVYAIDLQKQFYLLNIIKGNLVLVK